MDEFFIKVYHMLKNDILRLAFSFTKNLADAEDITQDVFIKLYENICCFNDDEHIKKWCIKVTVNKCKTLFLSSWKKKIRLFIDNEENILFQENNDSNILLNAILKLPVKYRIVIFLCYYEGYKIKEIADILNTNESTIKTRLQRAKKQLQIILIEEEYNDKQ